MKIFILPLIGLILVFPSFAQKKGDFSIGIAAGVSYQNSSRGFSSSTAGIVTDSSAPFSAALSPDFGYFVLDGLKLSLSAGYSFQKELKTDLSAPQTNDFVHLFAVGPAISYYIKLAPGFYLTPEIGAYYALGKAQQMPTIYSMDGFKNEDFVSSLYGFQLTANLLALEFKPSEKIGVGVSFGKIEYAKLAGNNSEGLTDMLIETIGFHFNASVSIGLRIYL